MNELGNTVIVVVDDSANHQRVDVRDDFVKHLPAAVLAGIGDCPAKSRDIVDHRLARRLCEFLVGERVP